VRLALYLEDYHPSVLLNCWLGHLTCKIVSEMTYNVSSGTLNPTIQYHRTPEGKGIAPFMPALYTVSTSHIL